MMFVPEFAIETRSLTKRFGSSTAVDSLSLQVPKGAVFGFLGPNGAGKTTTMRILLGLIKPTSGSARILGYDSVRERAALLPHIGAIVESPTFYPSFSGYDNLRVLDMTGNYKMRHRILEVLDMVGLSKYTRSMVHTYSLGMKQRLALAAILLHNPQLLFLDEPTNGLDPAGMVEIRELIRHLGTQGHTIFFSSHLLHEVEQVCDTIAIIHHGTLLVQKTGSLEREQNTVLIEATPLSVLQEVAAQFHVTPEIKNQRMATITLSSKQTPALVAALVHAGAEIYQITPQSPSLEQLFLHLTARESGDVQTRSASFVGHL